ncbi:MAG: PAS domain S-box protein, partial [Ignavibacteriales bacterium]|nr:PAS domain S-box protein [Ignavibacteriales bacterium]
PSIERCHELVVANRIAEQQLEYHQNVSNELLEKAPILVAVTTAEGKIEFINELMVDTYGYTMEELISNEISVLKSGETPDEVFKELWETISNGEEWSGEFVNKSKSGELFIEEARVVPLTDPTGEIRFFLKIARDVTEERALREQLDEARERIAELEEAAKGAGASGAGAAKAVSAKPAEDHDEPAITVSVRAQTVEEAERYRAALQKAKNDGSGSSAKKSPGSQTAVKKPSTARKGAGKSGGTKRKR